MRPTWQMLHVGRWELEPAHPGFRGWVSLAFIRVTREGSRTMRQQVGRKEAGTLGPGRPTTYREGGIQRGGGLFQQKVAFRYGSQGQGRSCREWSHYKPCMMGFCLLQPIPHCSSCIPRRPKFKPPTLEQ